MPKIDYKFNLKELASELMEEFASKDNELSIVDFINQYLTEDILGVKLSKAQWVILKSFYGIELSEEEISILEYWKIENRTTWDYDFHKRQALVLEAGRRSGKSFIGSIIALYEFYRLTRLKKPQLNYGVAINTPIVIQVMATSAKQGQRTIFGQIRGLIRSCPYFANLINNKQIEVLTDQIKYDEKLCYIYTGNSNSAGQVGQAIVCLIMDEVARFEDSETEGGKAIDIWSNIGISGATFRDKAIRIAISSAWKEGDAIETLYSMASVDKSFIGFRLKSSQVNPIMSDDNPIVVSEFTHRPSIAALEFHGIRSSNSEGFFDKNLVVKAFQEETAIRYTTIRENGLVKLAVDFVRPLPSETYIHLDPAITTDSYAMALGHKQDNKIIIDAVLFWEPSPGYYVSILNVQEVLIKIMSKTRIALLSCDQHNGVETLQRMSNLGVPCKGMWFSNKLQVDMYENCKRLLVEGRLILPDYQAVKTKIIQEAVSIKYLPSGKITHLPSGGKDAWDCIAAIAYHLNRKPVAVSTYLKPTRQQTNQSNYFIERRYLYE